MKRLFISLAIVALGVNFGNLFAKDYEIINADFLMLSDYTNTFLVLDYKEFSPEINVQAGKIQNADIYPESENQWLIDFLIKLGHRKSTFKEYLSYFDENDFPHQSEKQYNDQISKIDKFNDRILNYMRFRYAGNDFIMLRAVLDGIRGKNIFILQNIAGRWSYKPLIFSRSTYLGKFFRFNNSSDFIYFNKFLNEGALYADPTKQHAPEEIKVKFPKRVISFHKKTIAVECKLVTLKSDLVIENGKFSLPQGLDETEFFWIKDFCEANSEHKKLKVSCFTKLIVENYTVIVYAKDEQGKDLITYLYYDYNYENLLKKHSSESKLSPLFKKMNCDFLKKFFVEKSIHVTENGELKFGPMEVK